MHRYPIQEFGFQQYAAAGEPQAIHRGDFLAKKGVERSKCYFRGRTIAAQDSMSSCSTQSKPTLKSGHVAQKRNSHPLHYVTAGVGWVRLSAPCGPVDVYNTHLHANYSHKAVVKCGQFRLPGMCATSQNANSHSLVRLHLFMIYVGLARTICTTYMTVCMVISLLKMPCIIYYILYTYMRYIRMYVWFWPALDACYHHSCTGNAFAWFSLAYF
jgi:hypothetical protein